MSAAQQVIQYSGRGVSNAEEGSRAISMWGEWPRTSGRVHTDNSADRAKSKIQKSNPLTEAEVTTEQANPRDKSLKQSRGYRSK